MYLVCELNKQDTAEVNAWNAYVHSNTESFAYHLAEWQTVIEDSFALRTFYLYAKQPNGAIQGVLPLVLSKSAVFGTFLTSLPFFNYGGVLADNPESRNALLAEARAIAERVKAAHVELRHVKPLYDELPTKTHKVRMVLSLPPTPEALWESFKSKLRSQIKRPQKENMQVSIGGMELLDDFYHVFSVNMRDLGTPVWTKRLFENILRMFPDKAALCVVYHRNRPAAAGYVFGHNGCMEIPSASSLKKFNQFSPNMLLYWSLLEHACKKGYAFFDFGRSSPDAGTFKFKEQWGAVPETLHWQYVLMNDGTLPEINPSNPKYALCISLWKKLPVPLANLIGPYLSRNIP
ncbi:FemAB family PEP-CTERM system-associated protein [bacterium]|nr:FemAB family PEP-CTERM system-associated protein [bacterium]MCP5461680.1 FemAB family PEP-CTERM system-associated protein [bacterium]